MTRRLIASVFARVMGAPAVLVSSAGLAACAGATEPPPPVCTFDDFAGNWVDERRRDEGVRVGAGQVEIVAGAVTTVLHHGGSKSLVALDKEGLGRRFPGLASLGELPSMPRAKACVLDIKQMSGDLALVATGSGMLALLEEAQADPPMAKAMVRGNVEPERAPDPLVPPS